MKTETIAAIATSLSESGISIIRISGDQALSVADKIVVTKNGKKVSEFKTHTIHYGHIYDGDQVVDEVMVSFMKAPNSFTAENTVEINCHGGVLITKKILQLVLKNGARLAQPGEFTKRAFLNGRIDLSKAEAIMDIIHADNEFALQVGMKQLKGSVSEKVYSIREKLIYEIAFIESALDDPEHYSLDEYPEQLKEKISLILNDLIKMESSAENGKIIRQGINTVIVGKPNAGKSSFLNFLLGEEKAIVTDIAGTTRDVLEDYVRIQDISFHIIDTAGIRKTEDIVEKIGVEKAIDFSKDADLLLYIIDSSVALDENDYDIIKMTAGKKMIVLLNKSDLDVCVTEDILIQKVKEINSIIYNEETDFDNHIKIIKTSTKENEGIDIFTEMIKDMFFHGKLSYNDEVYITNMRHKEAIIDAHKSMLQVKRSLEDDMPEDFYSIDLMSAYASLGTIIGEEVGEDLVNEIFSKFCMGK